MTWFSFLDLIENVLGNYRADNCKRNRKENCKGLQRVKLQYEPKNAFFEQPF